jgi:septal ring factor EnvC (AmiA/AmiB activator)
MPSPARFLRLPACLVIAAVLFGAAPALIASPQSSTEQAAARKKLADVHSRMQALAKQQSETAARREQLNAELAKQATALAVAARALRQTEAEQAAKQQQLDDLQQQRSALQEKLAGQRAAIAALLRATYTLGRGSDLRLLLGDEDVGRISRALVYSTYFQRDRVERVRLLMTDLAHLQEVETSITAEQQALQAVREKREEQAQTLKKQRVAQQKLAREADATYQDQAQRLAALKENAQALNALVDKLQKAIDEAARKARQAAAREAAKQKRTGRKAPPVEVGNAGANIRGNLPWPAAGDVHSYGNGVLIRASGGSEIHAVARGRVIYAGFLRGYGMLLILNHGDGWMSMNGNNEALLHGVGDAVEAGQAIGTASAPTGINTGVYFELRHNSQPVDPRRWLSKHR